MLVLSRKTGESIVIDGGIRVTVIRVQKNRIKLAIEAPEDVRVVRQEVAFDVIPERKHGASESDRQVHPNAH